MQNTGDGFVYIWSIEESECGVHYKTSVQGSIVKRKIKLMTNAARTLNHQTRADMCCSRRKDSCNAKSFTNTHAPKQLAE